MNNPEAFKEDEVRSIKFIVPGLPFGKQRPKVTVRKFTGSDGKEKKFAKEGIYYRVTINILEE